MIRCTCNNPANCPRPHGYIPIRETPPMPLERQMLYFRADAAWDALVKRGGGKPLDSHNPNSDWYRWREAVEFSKLFSQLTAPFNEYHT